MLAITTDYELPALLSPEIVQDSSALSLSSRARVQPRPLAVNCAEPPLTHSADAIQSCAAGKRGLSVGLMGQVGAVMSGAAIMCSARLIAGLGEVAR